MSRATSTVTSYAPLRGRNITAVLGPTNTGKTYLAIERMLGHETGLIGLPLRLLAREVYDKVAARVGEQNVALVTGEEKIKPENPRYWISTVEAMPLELEVDFVAIDEIQLAGDPERGHVFTERLFSMRGTHETLLLGAQTMRETIEGLLPGANFISRPRLSKLTYAGQKKISRLPRRSAVVAFSAGDVYAIAELIRRQRGGAAVVLGALSPRTRNAQVELYQSEQVDFLVATDAIGMGLNLDVDHVAFAGVRKFDGLNHRNLTPGEVGQIAGRAGRHMNDGTFGVTGDVEPFESELVERLENHHFDPVKMLQWRNSDLDFSSVDVLRESLAISPRMPRLTRARVADDVLALEAALRDEEVRRLATSPAAVRRLWEVCQLPDYRKISAASHAELVATLYKHLLDDYERIPEDWFSEQVARCDKTGGDIDTLANRLAHIRTWTFVSNRADWLDRHEHWQGRTREIEDRLSDALHEKLTQRFVDKRTSALMRRMRDSENLYAEIAEDGAMYVEKHYVGRLQGFRFVADANAEGVHGKAARSAAAQVLASELHMRVRRIAAAKSDALELTAEGAVTWRGEQIAQLVASDNPLAPRVVLQADEHLAQPDAERTQERLDAWLNERLEDRLKPLIALARAEDVTGLARGVAFRLTEGFGILKREDVAEEIRQLDQTARAQLRRYGVRFGAFNIYIPALLKPGPSALLTLLWSLRKNSEAGGAPTFQEPPRAGLTSVAAAPGVDEAFYRISGYHLCGPRAVRIDMLERLSDMIRPLVAWRPDENAPEPPPRGATGDGGFTVQPDMMSILGCSAEELGDVLKSLGFRLERRKVEEAPSDAPATPAAEKTADTHTSIGESPQAQAPADARAGTPPDTAPADVEAERAPAASSADDDGQTTAEAATAAPATPPETACEDTTLSVTSGDGAASEPAVAKAHEGQSTAQPGADQPEFVEIWRPRRKGAGERQRRGARQGTGRRRGGRSHKSENASVESAQSPSGKQGKPKSGGRRSAAGAKTGGKQRSGQKPARAAKRADPDSPFAALSKLKEQLEESSDGSHTPS